MADWTRAEITSVTVEYEIPAREPWGANWNEVLQALEAARREYFETFKKSPSDDAVRVHPLDDSIKIVFEKKESRA